MSGYFILETLRFNTELTQLQCPLMILQVSTHRLEESEDSFSARSMSAQES